MKAIRNLLLAILVAAALGAVAINAGWYDVAADQPHWSATRSLLEFTRERSIAARVADLHAPPLEDPALIALGADHYAEMCTGCHLAPGMEETEIRAGLNPKPPSLLEQGAHESPETQFWIIKHGIRMTGMPAWGPTHDDRMIWGIVAFVRKLPAMTPEQYQALTGAQGEEPHDHEHGEHDHAEAPPAVGATTLDPAAREAAATIDRFQQALAGGQTRAAAALLAPDVLIFEGGGVERSRTEYASHHLGADSDFLRDAQVSVLSRSGAVSGDLAWIATESRIRKAGAKPLDLSSTETMVLRKADDGWRIVHVHWSSH